MKLQVCTWGTWGDECQTWTLNKVIYLDIEQQTKFAIYAFNDDNDYHCSIS